MATKITFFILFQFLFGCRIFCHNWEMFFPSFCSQVRPKFIQIHTFMHTQTHTNEWKAAHHEPYPFQQLGFIYFGCAHCSNKPHALSLHAKHETIIETNHQTESIDVHVHALLRLNSANLCHRVRKYNTFDCALLH